MNKILLCLIISICVISVSSFKFDEFRKNKQSFNSILSFFEKFIAQFNKKYTFEEFLKRLNIFSTNVFENFDMITFVNGEPRFNKFYDLTKEEFATTYLTLKPKNLSDNFEVFNPENIQETPESYNWVDQGVVTPVKDQGSCGSCWAFSTVGNIESQYAIFNNKQQLIFSEQQLVDCDHNGDAGCNGGDQPNAMEYLIKAGGLMKSNDYPYHAKNEKCKFNKSLIAVKVESYYQIQKDEVHLKEALYLAGPIAASINAESFHFYTGGIFNPKKCDPNNLNHAILLVGYGKDEQNDYWLVKNSWGEKWGEKGYIRILRGTNVCSIANDNWAAKIKHN